MTGERMTTRSGLTADDLGHFPRGPESPQFWGDDVGVLLPRSNGRGTQLHVIRDGRAWPASPSDRSVGSALYAYGAPAWTPLDDEHAVIIFSDTRELAMLAKPMTEGLAIVTHVVTTPGVAVGYVHAVGANAVAYVVDYGPSRRHVVRHDLDADVVQVLYETSDMVADLCGDEDELRWTAWPSGSMPWDEGRVECWRGGVVTTVDQRDGWARKAPGQKGSVSWYVREDDEWFRVHRTGGLGDETFPVDVDCNPPWTLGYRAGAKVYDGTVHLATFESTSRLFWWLADGWVREVETDLVSMNEIDARGDRVVVVGSTGRDSDALVEVNLTSGARHTLWHPRLESWDPASAEASVVRRTSGGTPFVFYGAKTEPNGDLPRLAVFAHGGPTGNAGRGFHPLAQYLSRAGVSCAFVDYRGSTSYGRTHRLALKERYGVVDVEDILDVARFMVVGGEVSDEGAYVVGGSSGGMTALLCGRDPSVAGVVAHFPVTDAVAISRDTEEIEAGYMDWLIGPLPDSLDRYLAVSPTALPAPSCRVLITQGSADPVVPASHTQAYVARLITEGCQIQYLELEGEGHGYRSGEAIAAVARATVDFILG